MSRTRLPDRRPSVTVKVEHEGMTFFVTFGYDPETMQVLEVFGNAKKQTTSFEYLVADACVAISLALQHGATPEMMLKSMQWEVVPGEPEHVRQPASIIGRILQAILSERVMLAGEPEL